MKTKRETQDELDDSKHESYLAGCRIENNYPRISKTYIFFKKIEPRAINAGELQLRSGYWHDHNTQSKMGVQVNRHFGIHVQVDG